jgi:Mn2+/Fe2+ NRAMP family transporter
MKLNSQIHRDVPQKSLVNASRNEATVTINRPSLIRRIALATAIIGPGLMVMFADTDAGSIITAAQSGAQWGYSMIIPQIILIPILFIVQEITVRLGIVTHQGHGELIRRHFGLGWALVSVITLFVAAIGALVTEFAGIAGVGEMFHIPTWITVPVVTLLLIFIGLSGSYKRVEHIGLAIGVLELMFIPAAIMAHPDLHQIAQGISHLPISQGNYVFLLAANVGAVIMPWMVFYQQGAIIDKQLTSPNTLKIARGDTWIGAILTQIIMIAVLVAMATTIGKSNPGAPLNSIQDIAGAMGPVIGGAAAALFCGLGMVGAGLLASLVVSLAGAWGIGEAFNMKHSLNLPFNKAPGFYIVYTLAHILGAVLIFSGISLVNLTVDVEIMNALLLPIVLGFLLALERVALPSEHRMKGFYKWIAWGVSCVVICFGLFMAGYVVWHALHP